MDEGLRARKKRQTRRRLVHAAVELAERDGVDTVTVADIADHAQVSRRTFFNYFSSREEALVGAPSAERITALTQLLAERPADEVPWVALRRALADLWSADEEPERSWAARIRLARSHPSLVGVLRAQFGRLEDALAVTLATRMAAGPDDLRPRLLVALAITTMRVAVDDWLDSGDDVPLAVAVDEALALVAMDLAAVDPLATPGPGSP